MSAAQDVTLSADSDGAYSLVARVNLRDLRAAHLQTVRRRVESGDVRELVDGVLAALVPASDTSLYSVTLSHGTRRALRAEVPKFAGRLERAGGGCLLPLDRGERGHEHVHGLLSSESSRVVLLSAWVEQTEAVRGYQRCRRIEGRWQVERALKYAFEPPKVGPERDLELDVWRSGVLAPAYEALLARGGLGAAAANKARLGPSSAEQSASTGWCLRCGVSLAHRRAGAATCSNACRMGLSRMRRRST